MEIREEDDKNILKKILSMIMPMTAENILQMMAGIVSMAMVGRISPLAVGAIGLGNILFRIIWAVFKGIATGATVFVAQSYGAGNNKKLISVSEQGFILAFFSSILLQQFLYWNAESLIGIFNPSLDLFADGVMYSRIISWSLPFAAIIILVSGILQGMGNARTPMTIISILNVVNIIFCYLLIFGNLGFPNLGLKGAAIAYNISYIVAALIGLYVLFSKKGTFKRLGENFRFKFNKYEALGLIKIGLPSALETSFWQLSSIIITRAILTYGETAYAAYQLGLQAEAVSYMPAIGFSVAASSFVGQAIGARDMDLGKKYLKELIRLTLIITTFASFALILFPKGIMRILTNDMEVIGTGATYLFVTGLVQIPQNVGNLFNGALRGAGYSKIPMLNVGIGIWIIRIPLVLIFTYLLRLEIHFIWISMGIDLIVRFFLSYFTLKKKDIFSNADPLI